MGMFDTVVLRCPDPSCDGEVEVQTKAGPCVLHDYHARDGVPQEVADDVLGRSATCRSCGQHWRVRREQLALVRLELGPYDDQPA